MLSVLERMDGKLGDANTQRDKGNTELKKGNMGNQTPQQVDTFGQ